MKVVSGDVSDFASDFEIFGEVVSTEVQVPVRSSELFIRLHPHQLG